MRKLGVLLAVLLLASACGQGSLEQVSKGPLKIGAIFALTSYGAQWGSSERDAAVLALGEVNAAGGINGRPLELVVEDNGSDLKKTATAAQKLINVDRVPASVGPQWSEFGVVAAPIFQGSRVVMISTSGIDPAIYQAGEYVFTMWPGIDQFVGGLAEYIGKTSGKKKFAVISAENAYTALFGNSFRNLISKIGATVSQNYQVRPEDKDFRTIITKLKLDQEQGVFISLLQGQLAPFFRQAKELGLNQVIYSNNTPESDEEILANPKIAEGVIYPELARIGTDAFLAKYQGKFGQRPSSGAAMAYDAVYLIANAMRQCGVASLQIQRCLSQTQGYQGASGVVSFDAEGKVGPKEYAIKTVKNGQFAVLQQ